MSEARRSQRYAVPTGRPFLLGEFRTKLAAIETTVRGLYEDAHPSEVEVVADETYLLFHTARNLAPARTYTGCERHPNGAIDPEAPIGWTRCLLCNEARRRGTATVDIPGIARTNGLGYPVPDGPYTLELLKSHLRRTSELSYDLSLRSSDSDFSELADSVHRTFIVARELSRPRNTSGCDLHPGAPTDPAADGACLFCVADRRRRQNQRQGVPAMIQRSRPGSSLHRRGIRRTTPAPPTDPPALPTDPPAPTETG
jgi:hypothetical protein